MENEEKRKTMLYHSLAKEVDDGKITASDAQHIAVENGLDANLMKDCIDVDKYNKVVSAVVDGRITTEDAQDIIVDNGLDLEKFNAYLSVGRD